jgi:hypothetical protein
MDGRDMKFPIIIENSSIPKYLSVFINIGAITLWPFVISRHRFNEQTLNHEKIHIRQQQELLLVGFYLLYVYYWLKGLWIYHDASIAYHSIPFEQEAYDNEHDPEYLNNRPLWAWRNYR